MGECGCGEMNIIDAFLVGNKVIAIDLYRGCRYCGADIGLKIHIFTKKQAKYWDIIFKDEFKPEPFGPGCRQPFWFGMEDLSKAIAGHQKDSEDYDNLSDFIDDFGYDILQTALDNAQTHNEWGIK